MDNQTSETLIETTLGCFLASNHYIFPVGVDWVAAYSGATSLRARKSRLAAQVDTCVPVCWLLRC